MISFVQVGVISHPFEYLTFIYYICKMNYKVILEEIFQVYNVNAREFANKIDVQRSSISHVLSGRNRPSLDFLIKVKREFPELRWDYLLLGEKPMTESEEKVIQYSMEGKQAEEVSSPTLFEPISEPEPVKDKVTLREEKREKKIAKIVWFYDDNSYEVFENK